jgi:elongation factor Ts
MSNLELLKSIRHKTGLPIKDINKAIEKAGANEEEVIKHLREQGVLKQQTREGRETNFGGIFGYVHDGRLGILVEIKCETDFVARSDSFQEFGKDLALHIAAYQPKFVSKDQVDPEFIAKELEIARTQLLNEGKSEYKIEMILEGKKRKIAEEFSLLSQNYLKDPTTTVEGFVTRISQATGEKIEVSKFTIYNLNA